MVVGMELLKKIEDNVEPDVMNAEKYIKEVAAVCKDVFRAW